VSITRTVGGTEFRDYVASYFLRELALDISVWEAPRLTELHLRVVEEVVYMPMALCGLANCECSVSVDP
jgi:hypothetical protein